MTKLKSMFLLLRDRKNGRFAAAGCPVLSNNDGCVIARSYDAKPYVKMGAPYFQIKDVLRRHGIQSFSSNFGL
ncbi:hypothetical protein [Pseudomonas cannabina]|uniref:hypothetical protein n=1 Tax=Pseudomonas cannabina TaxID=86840 RepID=UPI001113AA7A|nr:hypothetical protein [Pseudomonas cannabina]